MDTDHKGYNHFGAPIPQDESKYDENGKPLNDYIPNYISNKPWYYEGDALKVDSNIRKRRKGEPVSVDALKHHKLDPDAEFVPNNEPRRGQGIDDRYDIVVEDPKKRRRLAFKGGCDNCGSTKHTKKDCLEKPRKVIHRFRKDDVKTHSEQALRVKKVTDDWETKRDQWHGYDSQRDYDEHLKQMKLQEQKRAEQEEQNKGDYDEDELAEMEELGILDAMLNSKSTTANGASIPSRALDEKAKYLEGISGVEQTEVDAKSQVYKDGKDKYLDEAGEFVREFEETYEIRRPEQEISKVERAGDTSKFEEDDSGEVESAKAELEAQREAKRRQLLEKYGAL
ncbi:hypothetical protein OGAPHI_003924 [Ogataea philodendri]|uniref:Pre-mRNA-splicing factor SLU7 n=1 Tax=Ogataea philodendri TaxID=1378263 RepID=A0A9P8T5B6_9ASCO|nr:uncharacterized protein OGAPHI_003924 [Ogataea philodendri]KAH3665736.1 hypothetical protein OGAPHI_003924 [Ogataea philodendri]